MPSETAEPTIVGAKGSDIDINVPFWYNWGR
jgi:hypothetical protein